MSAARTWFEALDGEMRGLVLEVIAISGDPTDAQLEEAPDLIAKSWRLDAIGIPLDKSAAVTTAIKELAKRLRGAKRR